MAVGDVNIGSLANAVWSWQERAEKAEAEITRLRSDLETAEHERAEEWRRRRDAEGSRDTAYAACDTMRMERDTALARNAEIEGETIEHLRGKNELVLKAYPAMDALDAIRAWCDAQPYANDTITVAKLRELLPAIRSSATQEKADG